MSQVRAKSPRSGRAETAQLLRAVEEAAAAGVSGEVMSEARALLRGTSEAAGGPDAQYWTALETKAAEAAAAEAAAEAEALAECEAEEECEVPPSPLEEVLRG